MRQLFRIPRASGIWLVLSVAALSPARAADVSPPPQPRPHGIRVPVPVEAVRVDDGDTIVVAWGPGEAENVRTTDSETPE